MGNLYVFRFLFSVFSYRFSGIRDIASLSRISVSAALENS